jgi:hypothetical protein
MFKVRKHSKLEMLVKSEGIENFLNARPTLPVYVIVDANHDNSIAGATFDRASANTTKNALNEHIADGLYHLREHKAGELSHRYDKEEQRYIMDYLVASTLTKNN